MTLQPGRLHDKRPVTIAGSTETCETYCPLVCPMKIRQDGKGSHSRKSAAEGGCIYNINVDADFLGVCLTNKKTDDCCTNQPMSFFLVLKSYLATGSLPRRNFFGRKSWRPWERLFQSSSRSLRIMRRNGGELDDGLQKWMTGWTLDLYELDIHEDTRIPISKEHVHCCIFWSRIHPQGWRIFTKFARGVFSLRADCALLVQEQLVPCLREKLQAVARHSCLAMLVKLVGVLMRGIF